MMKRFLIKGIVIIIVLEITLRIVVDPFYYYMVNTYTADKTTGFDIKSLYFNKENDKQPVDLLFIGNSRVPAAVDIQEIKKNNDTLKIINAARGELTGAINYWALKKQLDINPSFLNNSIVIAELQGQNEWVYSMNFENNLYTVFKTSPHLLLPHINFKILRDFIKYSEHNLGTKAKLTGLYMSAIYRTVPFIKQRLQEKITELINGSDKQLDMTQEGGIITDLKKLNNIRAIVSRDAKQRLEQQKEMKPYSLKDLDNSMLNALNILIKKNGGKLVLFDMPQHYVQQQIFTTDLNKKNEKVFKEWLQINNIPLIIVENFEYSDKDFLDYAHLKGERRKEFTRKLYKQIYNNFYSLN